MTEANQTSQQVVSKAVEGRKTAAWIAGLSFVSLLALAAVGVSLVGTDVGAGWFAQHGPAAIGIPVAVLLATAIVTGARALDGEASFTFLGAAIKGGGALLVGWLAVFTAVVLAIRALW